VVEECFHLIVRLVSHCDPPRIVVSCNLFQELMPQFSKLVLRVVCDFQLGCFGDDALRAMTGGMRFHERLVCIAFIAPQRMVVMCDNRPRWIGPYLKESFEEGSAIRTATCGNNDG